jgi:hypothetical protein
MILVATGAMQWGTPERRRLAAGVAVALTASFVVFVSDGNLVFGNDRLALHAKPQKMTSHPRRIVARQLVALAPTEGTALAPPRIAPFLAAEHDHPPLVFVRGTYLRWIATLYGDAEAELRVRMAVRVARPRYAKVQGPWDTAREPLPLDAFATALADHDVRSIALANRAPDREQIEEFLARSGFEKEWHGRGYGIWTLDRPWP